jgi:predicted nucleic acid-binding protein
MRLPERRLILDTNILVHWTRHNNTYIRSILRETYSLFDRTPETYISVVSKAELLSFTKNNKWGNKAQKFIQQILNLYSADISIPEIIDAYVDIDDFTKKNGKKMGKNDLWIAATAKVSNSVILTCDDDFDFIHTQKIVESELICTELLISYPPKIKIIER